LFEFKPSITFPPILQGGGLEDDTVAPITPRFSKRLTKFQKSSNSGAASALLTFELGDEPKKLVVWVWMKPEESAVATKIWAFTQTIKTSIE
jgi:hypothetical protein